MAAMTSSNAVKRQAAVLEWLSQQPAGQTFSELDIATGCADMTPTAVRTALVQLSEDGRIHQSYSMARREQSRYWSLSPVKTSIPHMSQRHERVLRRVTTRARQHVGTSLTELRSLGTDIEEVVYQLRDLGKLQIRAVGATLVIKLAGQA